MTLFKHELPILERDTEKIAILMPNREDAYHLPKKCVFAFLSDLTDRYALEHGCEKIAQFDNIIKSFPVYKTHYKGEEVCFCQAPLGAPAATQIMEFLIAHGVEYIIACGCCGVLVDIAENEILIPVEALRDEGTSYHYIEPARTIQLHQKGIDAIKQAADSMKVNYMECKTWTTDAFYRETKDMVAYRVEEGCTVVEMECSALAACAQFRGAVFGQLLFAADSLHNPDVYDERGWGMSSYEIAFLLSLEAVRNLGE